MNTDTYYKKNRRLVNFADRFYWMELVVAVFPKTALLVFFLGLFSQAPGVLRGALFISSLDNSPTSLPHTT